MHFKTSYFHSYHALVLAIGLAFTNMGVLAQTITPTDQDRAAALEQERRVAEQERVLREQLERRPNVSLQPLAPKTLPKLVTDPAESPCFMVHRIDFQTSHPKHLELFDWLPKYAHVIDPSLPSAFTLEENQDSPYGRCLGALGINILLTRLQNALVAQG